KAADAKISVLKRPEGEKRSIEELADAFTLLGSLFQQSNIDEGTREIVDAAVDALGTMGACAATPEVMQRLLHLLCTEHVYSEAELRGSDHIRRTAEAMGKMGKAAAEYPGVMRRLLELLDSKYSQDAAGALAKMGFAATEYPGVLAKLLAMFDTRK